jgi:hypothetical protein
MVASRRTGSMPHAITSLQQSMLREYAASIGLDGSVHYYGGARLRPVVPLDTAVNGVFILGAYPSARFESVGSENDVPVGDNLGPFEPERYFDGTRVRTQKSADELKTFYLELLKIERRACWVTDIVKVFLFKEGHRAKYTRLGVTAPPGYERERFEELAGRSMAWIERELMVARPRIVITLGAEIAGLLHGVKSQAGRNALLGPTISPVGFGSVEVPTVHLAHPGIVMRKADDGKNPWPRLHEEEHIPALRAALRSL